ncbi:hypothetical protein DP116_05865 [Brasilonema bromeliae SPC951]|uniref:Uncharacterized protein n=1 Tax=Brasilonema bromeliae SPC951 TaxID=385972 RepID=A0ABX1P562_9CYAN|nr:hypothetical protein [Brasilonema bromeliae SPC951]
MVSKLFVIFKNKGREQQPNEAHTRLLLSDQGQKRIEQAVLILIRYTCLTIANMHNAINCQ